MSGNEKTSHWAEIAQLIGAETPNAFEEEEETTPSDAPKNDVDDGVSSPADVEEDDSFGKMKSAFDESAPSPDTRGDSTKAIDSTLEIDSAKVIDSAKLIDSAKAIDSPKKPTSKVKKGSSHWMDIAEELGLEVEIEDDAEEEISNEVPSPTNMTEEGPAPSAEEGEEESISEVPPEQNEQAKQSFHALFQQTLPLDTGPQKTGPQETGPGDKGPERSGGEPTRPDQTVADSTTFGGKEAFNELFPSDEKSFGSHVSPASPESREKTEGPRRAATDRSGVEHHDQPREHTRRERTVAPWDEEQRPPRRRRRRVRRRHGYVAASFDSAEETADGDPQLTNELGRHAFAEDEFKEDSMHQLNRDELEDELDGELDGDEVELDVVDGGSEEVPDDDDDDNDEQRDEIDDLWDRQQGDDDEQDEPRRGYRPSRRRRGHRSEKAEADPDADAKAGGGARSDDEEELTRPRRRRRSTEYSKPVRDDNTERLDEQEGQRDDPIDSDSNVREKRGEEEESAPPRRRRGRRRGEERDRSRSSRRDGGESPSSSRARSDDKEEDRPQRWTAGRRDQHKEIAEEPSEEFNEEFGEDFGDDESGDSPKKKHRKIPTWSEAINLVVDNNLDNRGKHSEGRRRGRRRN